MLGDHRLLTDPALRARGRRASASGSCGSSTSASRAFNARGEAAGLRYPRYDGGFFTTVFAPEGADGARLLRCANAACSWCPRVTDVRVALCSVAERDAPRLVDELCRAFA